MPKKITATIIVNLPNHSHYNITIQNPNIKHNAKKLIP